MRARSFHVLQAAFSVAVLGCKKEPLPLPPPPPTATETTTTPAAVTTTTVKQAPGEKRFGQRCVGTIVPGLRPAQVERTRLRDSRRRSARSPPTPCA